MILSVISTSIYSQFCSKQGRLFSLLFIYGGIRYETGNTYGKRYSLTINNTTVNGFSTTEAKSPAVDGAELGTNVWGNKNYMTKDKLSVTIDGTKVY